MERTVADHEKTQADEHEARGFDLSGTAHEAHKTAGAPTTTRRDPIFGLKDVSVRYSGNWRSTTWASVKRP